MEEIWKDIQGYEGFYQVSNMGNVKSVERMVKHFLYGERFARSQILKPAKNNRGYLCVSLWKDGKGVSKTVHRLVLNAFNPNINNEPEINHIDGNKENNEITN
ncbi:MAG: HNH endonuclease, partial [Clostridia bacterium]|nr:HNH endonuclease [Clostridia bacterium]